MFVIRKRRRWIDDSPCWVVFVAGKTTDVENPYDKILFDTFEETVEWLKTHDAAMLWRYYNE